MTTEVISAIEIENEPLIHKKRSSIKQWSTLQLILFVIITVIVSCFASNLDRIVDLFDSTSSSESSIDSKYSFDTIIIGAGIAGLSAMHFLSSTNNKILLIEKSKRVGGRAFSYNIEYKNRSILCEGGAMRSSPSNYYFGRMLYRLRLCSDLMPMQSSNNATHYFIRNTYYNKHNVTEYFTDIFNFNPNTDTDLDTSMTSFFNNAFNQVLQENNNGDLPQTDEEWVLFRTNWTLNGELLKKWSLESFVKFYMNTSTEYWNYQNVMKHIQFNPNESILYRLYNLFGPPSKYDHINQTNDHNFPPNVQYTLNNGFNSVTQALYKNITDADNENMQILLNNELISVNYHTGSDGYKYIVQIHNKNNNELENYYSNNVILSMNAGSLMKIFPQIIPIYNDYVASLVHSIECESSYKINLIFDDIWIIQNLMEKYKTNSIFTDLAIRQFLFDNAWTNGTLTALQIYSRTDERTDYLNRLQQLGTPNNLYPKNQNIIIKNEYELITASKYVVDEIMRELYLLTNYSNIPYPIAAFVHPLNVKYDDIMDGLWRWKYGSDYNNVMSDIIRPIHNENIYICSTDYSYNTAYHYGGIQVALELATKYFDVKDLFVNASYCKNLEM